GHTGNNHERCPCRHARGCFLTYSAEPERVPAFEAHDEFSLLSTDDEDVVDGFLGHGASVGDLGGVDHLQVCVQPDEKAGGGEPVHDHHVGLVEQLLSSNCDQTGITGPTADQCNTGQRFASAPGIEGAVDELFGDDVTESRRSTGISTCDDPDGDVPAA